MQRLEEADQIACSSRRGGGLGGQRGGAIPAHNTVGVTPQQRLPGQTSNRPWGPQCLHAARANWANEPKKVSELCRACSGNGAGSPRPVFFDFINHSLDYSLDRVRKTTSCAMHYYKTCMKLGITIIAKSGCPFEFDRATVGKISDALPHELISLY